MPSRASRRRINAAARRGESNAAEGPGPARRAPSARVCLGVKRRGARGSAEAGGGGDRVTGSQGAARGGRGTRGKLADSASGRSAPRHVTIPHPEGRHVTIPGWRTPPVLYGTGKREQLPGQELHPNGGDLHHPRVHFGGQPKEP